MPNTLAMDSWEHRAVAKPLCYHASLECFRLIVVQFVFLANVSLIIKFQQLQTGSDFYLKKHHWSVSWLWKRHYIFLETFINTTRTNWTVDMKCCGNYSSFRLMIDELSNALEVRGDESHLLRHWYTSQIWWYLTSQQSGSIQFWEKRHGNFF